jgi:hypothetical protein
LSHFTVVVYNFGTKILKKQDFLSYSGGEYEKNNNMRRNQKKIYIFALEN